MQTFKQQTADAVKTLFAGGYESVRFVGPDGMTYKVEDDAANREVKLSCVRNFSDVLLQRIPTDK